MGFDNEGEHTLCVADRAAGLIQYQYMNELHRPQVCVPDHAGQLDEPVIILAMGGEQYNAEGEQYEEIFFQSSKMVKITHIKNAVYYY